MPARRLRAGGRSGKRTGLAGTGPAEPDSGLSHAAILVGVVLWNHGVNLKRGRSRQQGLPAQAGVVLPLTLSVAQLFEVSL